LLLTPLHAILSFFVRPIELIANYKLRYLQPDIVAGLTIAVVTLPQAVAYALIAELPPEAGLYSAIIGSVVGALWGSSAQLQTGPTNAHSLLVLSVLLGAALPGTPEYIVAASLMALMVGVVRLLMGLARLGVLVAFVSDSVIVGFTAGAGILILLNQIRHLLHLPIASSPTLWKTVPALFSNLGRVHWPSALVGLGTILLILLLRRINRRLPGPLLGMVGAALAVAILDLDGQGVRVIGELPRGFPPFSVPPVLDFDLMGRLVTGSLAVSAIGLVEAVSIARSISSQTGQRLDSNQEFVGQGMANIACAFFSGYTCSGSFSRSAVNYEAGAKTGLSNIFAALFVLIATFFLAPLAAYVPLTGLAGVLILTGYGLIDYRQMGRIWRSGQSDKWIMIATLFATLALPLQFAVLSGIGLSLITYLIQTSAPRVRMVLPESDFRHFAHQPERPACPQLGVLEILGDLYFGAAAHVEESVQRNLAEHPDQRFLLLRMHGVERCDISGVHMLESIVRQYRERNGDVYLVRVRAPVLASMEMFGFDKYLGQDHFLDPDEAIGYLFHHVIDPAVCIYECPVRAFRECQNLPKQRYPDPVRLEVDAKLDSIPSVSARALWQEIQGDTPPRVIDVREPREFKRAHIPGAESIPLPVFLNHIDEISRQEQVVMVCRGGRRSARATAFLLDKGYSAVRVLSGGMIAWEDAHLLQAVEQFGGTVHVGTSIT
jgi:SulP family sulfate permease